MDFGIDVLIRITRDAQIWVETFGPTKTPPKQVDARDMMEALMDYCAPDIQSIGLDLPDGCVYSGYKLMGPKVIASVFIIYVRAHTRTISYYNDSYTVPIPALLFQYELDSSRIKNSFLAVTEVAEPGLLEDGEMLYRFPYGGNVYNTGDICYGTNKLPDITTPRQLSSLPEYFLQLPFSGGSRELLVQASEKETFPKEWLDPYETYGQFKAVKKDYWEG